MASLYGVINSNRNFNRESDWGKNIFNSAFPIALANYMRDNGLVATYLHVTESNEVEQGEISFDDVFRCGAKNSDELYFKFEARYDPYQDLIEDRLDKIDCVVNIVIDSEHVPLAPIEIKLTVVPDNSTKKKAPDKQGCEIVVRSPTIKYMCLSIIESFRSHNVNMDVFELLRQSTKDVRNWANVSEMLKYKDKILETLELIVRQQFLLQRPMLMQTIWRTEGASARLANQCFDQFIWSDIAFLQLIIDQAKLTSGTEMIPRPLRSLLRCARFLKEGCIGRVNQLPIFDEMTYDNQNDKEFALNGSVLNTYLRSTRLTNPLISKEVVRKLIVGGGQEFLSPERRLDAAIVADPSLFS